MPALLDDTELLRRLVGFDSVSRNGNLPIAGFIADYLDRPGIRVRRNESADESRTNLVIESGPPADPATRDGLMLSGHMDVVPADEPEWTSDPFRMEVRGDAFQGRGTADMKGFLALAINRLAQQDPLRLRRPLALLFTYDEELGTLGAERFSRTWANPERLPRQVVVGEPTSLRAVRMHKGHLNLRLTFRGTSAHSGYPHLGRSAIEPAGQAIVALTQLRTELEQERPPHADLFPEVPFVALNIGTVRGGSAVNIVPDRCEIALGIRVLPGMRSSDLTTRVRDAVGRALPGHEMELEMLCDAPPFLLDADRPLHRHICSLVHQGSSESVAFATDAGWLSTMGFDCVVWGPGTIEVAHKPNESLPIAEFSQAGDLLDRLVYQSCVVEAAR
ncbi:MAG: argE [Gemmatimonadetes bacterium]|nr:argE [Gemmatimonadota bacterium]